MHAISLKLGSETIKRSHNHDGEFQVGWSTTACFKRTDVGFVPQTVSNNGYGFQGDSTDTCHRIVTRGVNTYTVVMVSRGDRFIMFHWDNGLEGRLEKEKDSLIAFLDSATGPIKYNISVMDDSKDMKDRLRFKHNFEVLMKGIDPYAQGGSMLRGFIDRPTYRFGHAEIGTEFSETEEQVFMILFQKSFLTYQEYNQRNYVINIDTSPNSHWGQALMTLTDLIFLVLRCLVCSMGQTPKSALLEETPTWSVGT